MKFNFPINETGAAFIGKSYVLGRLGREELVNSRKSRELKMRKYIGMVIPSFLTSYNTMHVYQRVE